MSSEDEFYSAEESDGGADDNCSMDYDYDDNENYSDGGDDDMVPEDDDIIDLNYTVLSEEDVMRDQDEVITEVCSALSLSRGAASILLRNYNWSVEKAQDAWFSDEEKVRTYVGLVVIKPVVSYRDSKKFMCRICFDMFKRCEMHAASCGHPFCEPCWRSYVRISISDGPGCLNLRCPDPKCVAAVDEEMVGKLVCKEDMKKYSSFAIRSFVEASKKVKWCPAPGCENAVELERKSAGYDVTCKCKHPFCWNCSEDAHRPVNCETVAKWGLKNSSEAENTEWLIANTKPCPKCRKPIEKNQGCMHMTCAFPCRFEFCWLCLGPWEEHGESTGGFMACNIYTKEKEEGKFDEEERKQDMAKKSLERYTHYYERWAGNQKSRVKAVEDLQKLLDQDIEKLAYVQVSTIPQLKFITDAWLQIIECRRVLKWTYAYGYYLPEDGHVKKQLFEFLQGQAEACLERLHDCAEKEVQDFVNAKGPSHNFNEFCKKLISYTKATHSYFENLVQGLENGLADVDCRT